MPTAPSTAHRYRGHSSMAFRGRSVLSLRRNQVAASSAEHFSEEDNDLLHDFDHFQSHVTDQFVSLAADTDDQFLSLPFLHKLFDSLLSCEHEFRNLLLRNPNLVSKSPVDKHLSDLLDRTVKSLDICNDLTQNLQLIRHWNRHADIAASALTAGSTAPGQLRRAKKALCKLLEFTNNEENNVTGSVTSHQYQRIPERAWSFLSRNREECSFSRSSPSSTSSSRSLSRTLSAGRQIQAMSANLLPPRDGGALAVYTMSWVSVFAMWALVAAFPDTSSGPVVPVGPTRRTAWGPAMGGMQERIVEQWRKKGKRGGVLAELVGVERCGKELMEAVVACEDQGGCGAQGSVVACRASELEEANGRLEEGLAAFEVKLREVFHRLLRGREEVVRCLDERSSGSAPPFIVM